ncbi:MAG: hypothetical protein AAFP97_04760 [Pseudomonadota bacterium]
MTKVDQELTSLFADSRVPAPSADLADRIVAAAKDQAPLTAANDRKPWIWTAAAGIAATLVAGVFVMTQQPSEAELWADQADQAGFGDLYEWVYSEGS